MQIIRLLIDMQSNKLNIKKGQTTIKEFVGLYTYISFYVKQGTMNNTFTLKYFRTEINGFLFGLF